MFNTYWMEETSSYYIQSEMQQYEIKNKDIKQRKISRGGKYYMSSEFISTITRELQKKIYHVIKIQRKRGR